MKKLCPFLFLTLVAFGCASRPWPAPAPKVAVIHPPQSMLTAPPAWHADVPNPEPIYPQSTLAIKKAMPATVVPGVVSKVAAAQLPQLPQPAGISQVFLCRSKDGVHYYFFPPASLNPNIQPPAPGTKP